MRRTGRREAFLIEEWPKGTFARELRERDRMLVLYYSDWCPFSRIFMPMFEAAQPEASVPFGRVNLRNPMDPRWDEFRIHAVPTLVYYEHGEELERADAVRGRGLSKGDLEETLEAVEAIQEEPTLPRRMHGARRS